MFASTYETKIFSFLNLFLLIKLNKNIIFSHSLQQTKYIFIKSITVAKFVDYHLVLLIFN